MAYAYWSPEQDEILCARYPTEGNSMEIRTALGRDWASVWHRAKRLGLKGIGAYVHPNFTGFGGVSGEYVGSVRRSARHRGLSFELTASDINGLWLAQGQKCCYSGRLVSFVDKTASVDRIDAKQGYIRGNVRWIHKDINEIKWDLTDEEFLLLVKDIAATHPEP